MQVCWPCLSRERGWGRQGTGVMVLSLSAVSRDSVMIGCKLQRASSGGV